MAIEVYLYEPFSRDNPKPEKRLLYSTENPKLYDFAPGVLKDEVNRAGSFEFDIYPNHQYYKKFMTFYSYIGVEDSNQYGSERVLFYGRVINFTIDIYGGKHVLCEGLLANLLDCPAYMPADNSQYDDHILSIESQGTWWLFLYPLTAYDELLLRHDIKFGDVDYAVRVMSDEPMVYKNSFTQSCGDFIMSLLDSFGGLLEMVYQLADDKITGTLYWKTDPITEPNRFPLNSQTFKLGENIISASFDESDANKIGGFFPYAIINDSEGNEHYYYGTYGSSYTTHLMPNVIDSDGNKRYGYIRPYPVKTVQLEGANDSNFRSREEQYAILHGKDYVNDVTVNAVDEYFIGKASRRIHIMDRVHVVVPYADYDETKYCLSYELDIANPANSQFKFGDYKPVSSQKAYYISTHISGKNK